MSNPSFCSCAFPLHRPPFLASRKKGEEKGEERGQTITAKEVRMLDSLKDLFGCAECVWKRNPKSVKKVGKEIGREI